eukprot:217300-Hanusia_phi.AAC.1
MPCHDDEPVLQATVTTPLVWYDAGPGPPRATTVTRPAASDRAGPECPEAAPGVPGPGLARPRRRVPGLGPAELGLSIAVSLQCSSLVAETVR